MTHPENNTPGSRAWLAWLEEYAQATERTLQEIQDALEKVRKNRNRERCRHANGPGDTNPLGNEN